MDIFDPINEPTEPTEDDFDMDMTGIPSGPDKEIALAFAEAFCGDQPDRLRLAVYGVPGMARDFEHVGNTNAIAAHWDELVALQDAGNEIFFYLNELKAGPGSGHKGIGTNADVEQLATLSVDFDGGLPDHYHVEPDIVIKTSRRLLPDGRFVQRGQALWRVRHYLEGYQKEGMAPLFKRTQQTLAAYYDPEGWAGYLEDKKNPGPQITDKKVTDLRRVHRMPGFLHLKDPDNPQMMTFEPRYSGPPRALAQIIGRLPPVEDAAPEQEQRTEGSSPPEGASEGVAEIVLRETLSFIDPPSDEGEWWKLTAAIKATPLLDGDGEQVHLDWSWGKLNRKGKYAGGAVPDNWGGEKVARAKYRSAKAEGAKKTAGFGTLIWEARKAGMPENRISFDEKWGSFAETEAPVGDRTAGIEILNLTELRQIKPPRALIKGLLYERQNVALVAMLKTGKTFVALDISLSIATGLPVFGGGDDLVAKHVGAVVYSSAEGHAGIPARVDAWCQARGVSIEMEIPFFYIPTVPQAKDWLKQATAYIEAIRAKLGEQTVILFVVDTLARAIIGLDENTTDSANAYLAMTELLVKEMGCTVLTVAHATHKGQNSSEKINQGTQLDFRGSSGFGAGLDTTWTLMRADRGDIAELKARWSKDMDLDDLRTFHLRTVSETLPDGRKSAALELRPEREGREEYRATWHTDSLLAELDSAEDLAEGTNLIKLVEAVLLRWRAWPNSGFTHGWVERDSGVPASGGMGTSQLAEEVLMTEGKYAPTQTEIENMMRKLQYHAKLPKKDGKGKNAAGPLCRFVRKRDGGFAWALPVVP